MNQYKYSLGDDQPKRKVAEDRLGYSFFAKRIADIITNIKIENGYVVGLHGRWGAGKTTVVNFVLEYIQARNVGESDKEIECIEFRPWVVSGHQDLMAAFFKHLSEYLKPKKSKTERMFCKGVRRAAEDADKLVDAAATMAVAIDPSGGAFSRLAGAYGKKALNSYLSKFLDTPSLQAAYEDLREQLRKSNRRFLVTIDDIDRLNDEEIKSIMQMVKTIGRLPNVIYLLVYDREIVWQALGEDSDRIGPRFVEKIVQQEIELPPPGKNALLAMLDEEIEPILADREISTRWRYIVQDGVHRWINSPRDVLRFSNALKFAWPTLKGEFDPYDLVAIEGIRLYDPIAFDWIRRNRDFLFNEGRYIIGAENDRRANIEALKSSLPPATVNSLIRLLTVLFPGHGKWFEGDGYRAAESYVASQARRGLASEAGYDAYFALRPSVDAIPQATIDTVFENLNDEKEITNALRAYLGKNNSRGKAMIGLFLQDLRTRFAVQPKPKPSQELLNALLSIADEVFAIPWRGGMFTLEPSGTLSFLVRDMLEAWGEVEAGRHLIAAYERSDSPFVLADLYVDRGRELGVFPNGDPGYRVLVSRADFDKLGCILLPKIRAAADEGTLVDAPYYWNIVRSWNYLGDAVEVKEWLRRGIERDGRFTAKVAKGMLSEVYSGDGVHYRYRQDYDDELYDINLVYGYANRHLGADNDLSDDERAVLRALIEGVDKMKAGKS